MTYPIYKRLLALSVLLLMQGSAWAQEKDGSFSGFVRDVNGIPVKSGEIRVRGKDGKIISSNKTDKDGRYVSNSLPAGTYEVSLVINSQVRAFLHDAKLSDSKPTTLNFDFRGQTLRKGYWIKDTGTHISRWVDGDDPSTGVGAQYMLRTNTEFVRRIQEKGKGL
jgi:hypothetical protein